MRFRAALYPSPNGKENRNGSDKTQAYRHRIVRKRREFHISLGKGGLQQSGRHRKVEEQRRRQPGDLAAQGHRSQEVRQEDVEEHGQGHTPERR